MKMTLPNSFEVVPTHALEVACDGGSSVVGHPLVYLHINPAQGEVICPYCSRTFRLEQSAA